MASDVQPGDIIRGTLKMIFGGTEEFQSVYHYQHQGAAAITAAECTAGLAGEVAGWIGYLIPLQHTSLYYESMEFYNVTQDEPMGVETADFDFNGTSSDSPLPLQANALVMFDGGAKRSLGKKYLPAFGELYSAGGGQVQATLLTALANYAAGVLGGVFIDGNSFKAGHVKRATGAFVTWITPIIDSLFRTQRRRVIGVGI